MRNDCVLNVSSEKTCYHCCCIRSKKHYVKVEHHVAPKRLPRRSFRSERSTPRDWRTRTDARARITNANPLAAREESRHARHVQLELCPRLFSQHGATSDVACLLANLDFSDPHRSLRLATIVLRMIDFQFFFSMKHKVATCMLESKICKMWVYWKSRYMICRNCKKQNCTLKTM